MCHRSPTGHIRDSGPTCYRYDALKAFLETNGGKYPAQDDPTRLGGWINDQRTAYRKGLKRLSADRIEVLEQRGDRRRERDPFRH